MMLFSHWLLWLKNCRFSTNSCKGFIVPLTQQAACSTWKHKVHTKVFISWNAISFFMASSTIWSYFQWFVKSKTKEFCGWQLIILWKGLSSYSRVYRITCDVALCLSCLIHFICTRHFRPKLVNLNESVYCTPIDRASKMWFNERSGSFLWPTIPEL